MGFHKTSASRNMRTPEAHLERRDNGDIYAYLKCGFTKNAKRFEYCFIGEQYDTLTFDGHRIEKHPRFTSIDKFETWCNRYKAEHDL